MAIGLVRTNGGRKARHDLLGTAGRCHVVYRPTGLCPRSRIRRRRGAQSRFIPAICLKAPSRSTPETSRSTGMRGSRLSDIDRKVITRLTGRGRT